MPTRPRPKIRQTASQDTAAIRPHPANRNLVVDRSDHSGLTLPNVASDIGTASADETGWRNRKRRTLEGSGFEL